MGIASGDARYRFRGTFVDSVLVTGSDQDVRPGMSSGLELRICGYLMSDIGQGR